MQKQKNPLPKRQRTIRVTYPKKSTKANNRTAQQMLANMVMALPIAEGAGLLPSIGITGPSAAATAMAAPIALTLAGPAYSAYQAYTGEHNQVNVSPEKRASMPYSSDATRVNTPPNSSQLVYGNSQVRTVPTGYTYLDPAIAYRHTVDTTTSTAPADSSRVASPTDSVRPARGTASPTPPIPPKPKGKPAQRKKNNTNQQGNTGQGSQQGNTGQENNSPNLFEKLWGNKYARRATKLVGGVAVGAPAIDIVGNLSAISQENPDSTHTWNWKLSEKVTSPIKGGYIWLGRQYSNNPPKVKTDTVPANQLDSSQVSRSNTNSNTQFNPGKQAVNNDSLTQEQLQALMNELF